MAILHDILFASLLVGGVLVEISLVRFLATLRRVKGEELDLLLRPPHVDPTPSEMFEVIHATSGSIGSDWSAN
jgi:hypothetical protein